MIPNTVTFTQPLGTGVATAFPFGNKIFQAQDLVITQINTGTVPQTLYPFVFQSNNQFYNATLNCYATVSNVDVDAGCTVTFSIAPTAGWIVDLRTQISETQPTSIKNQGQFLPDLHEEAVDRVTRLVQDLYRQGVNFSVRAPDIEATPWPQLPAAGQRLGLFLQFDPVLGLPSLAAITASVFNQTQFNAFLAASGTQIQPAYKSVATYVNSGSSGTSLITDPQLTVSLPAAGAYCVTSFLNMLNAVTTAQGFKCQLTFTGSGTASGGTGVIGNANATAVSQQIVTVNSPVGIAAVGLGGLDWIELTGAIYVTSAGTLSLQWAQNSPSANNTGLNAGSSLTATPI